MSAGRQERAADAKTPRPRELLCEACGASFGCVLDGPCWCSEEAYRMPLPKSGEGPADCLCPKCLRARAAAKRVATARPEGADE